MRKLFWLRPFNSGHYEIQSSDASPEERVRAGNGDHGDGKDSARLRGWLGFWSTELSQTGKPLTKHDCLPRSPSEPASHGSVLEHAHFYAHEYERAVKYACMCLIAFSLSCFLQIHWTAHWSTFWASICVSVLYQMEAWFCRKQKTRMISTHFFRLIRRLKHKTKAKNWEKHQCDISVVKP